MMEESAFVQLSKQEKEAIDERISRYHFMLQQVTDAMIVVKDDGTFVEVNEAACRLFRAPKEQLLRKKFQEYTYLVPEHIFQFQKQMLRKFGAYDDELVIRLADGELKHVQLFMRRHQEQQFDLYMIRDISSKKALERERTINETLFKDLFNRAGDGIVIFDGQGRFIDANPSFCASVNVKREELFKLSIQTFIPIEYHDLFDQLLLTLKRNGTVSSELPFILGDGMQKLFELTLTANVHSGFFMAIMRNVTEKRNMEINLQRSEERFRAIFEQAHEAIIICDDFGNILRANPAASRTFELPLHDLVHANLLQFMDGKNKKVRDVLRQFFRVGQIRDELTFHMPNGEKKQLEFTSKKGVINGYHLTIFRNVSERRKMEKQLREQEQKFRSVFNHAMDGIVLIDDQQRIFDANPAACRIFSLQKEQLLEKCMHEFIGSNDLMKFQTWLNDGEEEEFCIIDGEGKKKIVELSFKPNIIEHVGLMMMRDMTEKKEMEEQLRKSDTLNVVGQLAAGIAHEIRNPMTALKGFIQLLQGSIGNDCEQHNMYFHVIMSELKRIESIITEFLVLAKPQAIHYERGDVARIMQETVDLLSVQATMHNIQIEATYEQVPLIYCEPKQLKQVFINILKNAIEVMPNGGTITVSVSRVEEGIRIAIRDEGSGIPKEKIKKLGEPFYTTKERGTGLGLMVSYKIIEEHHGRIDVESEVGVGTTFYITLPVTNDMQ
ncbi:PAS domain-containing sensor histidine kinase [Anoxybacillus ayderensis]|uniref:PAS domain-containing sensor histidine kinase n=1 Tax=Anoxybacillus sp. ST70 TaxID=2864180 RepID=UPI0005244E39|nr:PAS domain-containing sensor histidine kinase [Anoxybacillus sp. ST70]AXM90521.1 PAS domain-containing sensor histidine kinase [Anoxybacillus ayderensis G10]MBW9217285.1 PAS domain S-box protein [Anoxybacillus sp. ST70]THD16068.1 PAS domain-containing sensor histidine kinase [Anoxybacillus ayderensis]